MTNEIIDAEITSQLFVLDSYGDDSFSQDVLDTLTAQVQDVLQRMRAALANQDYDEIQRAAHYLKGSSLSVGSLVIPSICAALEISPKTATEASFSAIESATADFLVEFFKMAEGACQ